MSYFFTPFCFCFVLPKLDPFNSWLLPKLGRFCTHSKWDIFAHFSHPKITKEVKNVPFLLVFLKSKIFLMFLALVGAFSLLSTRYALLLLLSSVERLLEALKGLEVFFSSLSRILCVLKMSGSSGLEQCESSRGRAASRKSQMRQRPEHKWQSQDTNLPGCKPRLGTLGRQLSEAT